MVSKHCYQCDNWDGYRWRCFVLEKSKIFKTIPTDSCEDFESKRTLREHKLSIKGNDDLSISYNQNSS